MRVANPYLVSLLIGVACASLVQCGDDSGGGSPAAGMGGGAGSSGAAGKGGSAGSSAAAGDDGPSGAGADAGGSSGADPGGSSGDGGDAGSAGSGASPGGGVGGNSGVGGGGTGGGGAPGGTGGAGGAAGGGSGAACGRAQSAALVLGQASFTTNTPALGATGLTGPFGAAVDPTTGKVFVADYVNNRVLRYPARASLTNGAAAEAVLGQADFTSSDISTTASRMRNPVSVAVDSAGRLWVVDQGHHRVLRFDAAASKPSASAADGVLGQDTFTNAVPERNVDSLNFPAGVAVDAAGRLFVADFNNNRVLRFDAAASKANGGDADGVLGQPNFDQGTLATSQAGLWGPQALALDSAGRLWVADKTNNRVVRFDSAATKANGAAADAVLGQPDFTERAAQTLQDVMSGPTGVAVDMAGVLWVADRENHRLLCFTNPAAKPSGGLADGVLGQTSFTSATTGTAQDRVNAPTGVASDSAGYLLVADYENHRVLFFAP